MILVKYVMDLLNQIVSRAIRDRKGLPSMTKGSKKLFVCALMAFMRILSRKIVFLAIRIVVPARAKSPLPVLLVLKEIF